MLYRVAGTDESRPFGIFIRAGGTPNDRNLVNFYADGGLLYKGLVPRRPDDKVGIAAAQARIGNNARGLDTDIGLFGNFFYPVRSSETMIEDHVSGSGNTVVDAAAGSASTSSTPAGGVLNPDGSLRRNALVIGVRSSTE